MRNTVGVTHDEAVVDTATAGIVEFIGSADPSVDRERYGVGARIGSFHEALVAGVLGGLPRFVEAAREELARSVGDDAWGFFDGVRCRASRFRDGSDALDLRGEASTTYRLVGERRSVVEGIPYDRLSLYREASDAGPMPVLVGSASFSRIDALREVGIDSLVVLGSRPVVDEAESIMDVADMVRPALRGDLRIPLGPMPARPDTEILDVADGGFPGDHWRSALRRIDDARIAATMRWASNRIDAIIDLANGQGLVLGQAYLAYDDTDKRVFAIPGRKAFLYEDLDLVTSWSSFVLDVHDGVATTYVLDRDECDFAGFLASYPPSTVAEGVVSFRIDLATGAVERSSASPVGDAMDNLRYGTLSVSRVLERIRDDKLDLGFGDEIRHDFSPYEKRHDPLYDEAPAGPTP